MHKFQIAFCYFNSDSPEFLHVALNSFRKHCSNVLITALLFVCDKNGNLAHNFCFFIVAYNSFIVFRSV